MSHVPVDSFRAVYSGCCLWCTAVTLGPGYSERNMIRPLFLRSSSSRIMWNMERKKKRKRIKKRLTALQQVRKVVHAAQLAPLVSCPGRTLSSGPPWISYR